MSRTARIAIIGAGPIGLEAAVFGKLSGYEALVYERGAIAHNLRDWGHVRLFSPFGMNISPWGRDLLEDKGYVLPGDDDLLTGREFAEAYFEPLAEQIADSVHCQTEVAAIGRAGLLKQDQIGDPARAKAPFRLLLKTPTGEEIREADFVLDCSGTYPHHNWAGADGIPCPGERETLSAKNYVLPDILGKDRERFANRWVLVVGGGYSAATAVAALAELSRSAPETKTIWLTKNGKPTERPIEPIPNDALPERHRLTAIANELVMSPESPIDWAPGFGVQSIRRLPDGRLQVAIENANGRQVLIVDEFLAQVGYRPDRRLYEELQIHECYATGGPMKLAAALLGETSADCLNQTSPGGETLKNPEPGFYILGAKSYGRNSRFLLKVGIEQIREAFSLIAQDRSRR